MNNNHDVKNGKGLKSTRGFASMDKEKQRAIASKGGQSVPVEKRSFSQSRDLAIRAGRKGGQSVPEEKRSFSVNPGLAAKAGRKGGQSSHTRDKNEHEMDEPATTSRQDPKAD